MTGATTTIGDLAFSETPGHDTLWTAHTHLGRVTVLYRDMGFDLGHNYETGFRDLVGGWFLRQDFFDIRRFPTLTIEQAIAKIKAGEDDGKSEGDS